MNKALTIIGLLLFLTNFGFSQTTLYGKITNQETGSDIEEATIFITSTTKSTVTNSKGFYLLENIGGLNAQVIVYAKGFEMVVQNVDLSGKDKQKLEFQLRPNKSDSTPNKSSISDKKVKRYLKSFNEAFLGYSKNSNKCLLKNPEVLVFQENQDGSFEASATDLLKIDNNSSGYEVTYLLESFKLSKGELPQFRGKAYYEEKSPEDVKDIEKWDRNRKKQYFGSPQHFFKALNDNELRSSGFKIYVASLANKSQFIELNQAYRDNIFEADPESPEKYLTVSNYLKVVYENEADDIEQKLKSIGLADIHLIKPSGNNFQNQSSSSNSNSSQISYLTTHNKKLDLNENGYPKSPELIHYRGYWGYEGISDWIPIDYFPTSEKEATVVTESFVQTPTDSDTKNGFQLTNSLVRQEYITESGLQKDGRPAIDNPNFVRSAQARDFLKDDDLVLGVAVDDIAKAYPVRILNLHEVVNDNFGGQAVTVSYSPLCRSGMAFLGETKSGKKTFGSSGLVFNNGLLLYDRETNSLWSQIMGRAITGSESGNPLELVPSIITTFKNWRKLHPGSKIMSTNTGYAIDYSGAPFRDYHRTQEVKYHVMRSSDNLPNKEMVMGVQIGFRTKAYPFSELRKTDGQLEDSFNGKQYTIHYDDASASAWVTDRRGERIAGTSMYWFAWYAFHPETVVFWNDERG